MTLPIRIHRDDTCSAQRFAQCLLALCLAIVGVSSPATAFADDAAASARAGFDLGAVIDVRRGTADGVRVLAVTPGGAADRIGLRTGDRLRAINGHSFANANAPADLLARVLREGNGAMRMDVVRDGKPLQLSGTADARPPSMASGCGYVTTLGAPPRISENIHQAGITMIDGRSTPLFQVNRHQLDAGRHVLVVSEHIDRHLLSSTERHQIDLLMRRSRVQGTYKALVVDIKPGTVYHVGARLLRDKLDSASIRANAYWEPVIWQERPMRCP